MTALPTFRGYTVDYRLGEFRRLRPGKAPEYVSFGSDRGRDLLREMQGEQRKKANKEVRS